MHLAHYVSLLHRAESDLAAALRTVASAHHDEADIQLLCSRLAEQCDHHESQLQPFVEQYRANAPDEPDQLYSDRFGGPRTGPLGLLRDLHDLYVMAAECDICWTLVGQAAQGARDRDLFDVVRACEGETATHQAWLRTRLK